MPSSQNTISHGIHPKKFTKSYSHSLLKKINKSTIIGVCIKTIQAIENTMSRRDDITGAKALNGYRSSKSNNKTKHLFKINLQKKKFYLPEEDMWVTLKVTAKTLRSINRKGLSAVLKKEWK